MSLDIFHFNLFVNVCIYDKAAKARGIASTHPWVPRYFDILVSENFARDKVEVIVLSLDSKGSQESEETKEKNPISYYAGRLKKFGNGLQYQQKIRNEW